MPADAGECALKVELAGHAVPAVHAVHAVQTPVSFDRDPSPGCYQGPAGHDWVQTGLILAVPAPHRSPAACKTLQPDVQPPGPRQVDFQGPCRLPVLRPALRCKLTAAFPELVHVDAQTAGSAGVLQQKIVYSVTEQCIILKVEIAGHDRQFTVDWDCTI